MNAPLDKDAIRRREQGAQMLARIEDLLPMFRRNAAQARDERRVPQENIDALQEAGFFLALQPRRFGGFELDPQDFFRMQMALLLFQSRRAYKL